MGILKNLHCLGILALSQWLFSPSSEKEETAKQPMCCVQVAGNSMSDGVYTQKTKIRKINNPRSTPPTCTRFVSVF